jgi:hypothetical protein
MTVADLILELAALPPELEVVYDFTHPGETSFRLVVVTDANEIESDSGDRMVLLNASLYEEGDEDDSDDE